MDASTEVLRKQIMIGHFVNAVGCTTEQATQILQSAHWHFEAALSLFFQEHAIVAASSSTAHGNTAVNIGSAGGSSLGARMACSCVPTNTPATPPSLPETLAAFAQMKASSPDGAGLLQEPPIVHCQTQASKS